MVEEAHFAEDGTIIATIDGHKFNVPDNTSNRHRQMIKEWESDGHRIAPHSPADI